MRTVTSPPASGAGRRSRDMPTTPTCCRPSVFSIRIALMDSLSSMGGIFLLCGLARQGEKLRFGICVTVSRTDAIGAADRFLVTQDGGGIIEQVDAASDLAKDPLVLEHGGHHRRQEMSVGSGLAAHRGGALSAPKLNACSVFKRRRLIIPAGIGVGLLLECT